MSRRPTPRHGSETMARRGCTCPPCITAGRRARKARDLHRLTIGPRTVAADPVLDRIEWWNQRGVATGVLSRAAGLYRGTLDTYVSGRAVGIYRDTLAKVLAVTWDDIPDNAHVAGDLTRYRVRSLQASGHTLGWVIEQTGGRLSATGKWRTARCLRLSTARLIQDVYANAPAVGPSTGAATKARAGGHMTVFQWDDPAVPAMPFGWTPTPADTPGVDGTVDHAVVERVMAGDYAVPANDAERTEIVRRWREAGRSLAQLERSAGWNVHRYREVSA